MHGTHPVVQRVLADAISPIKLFDIVFISIQIASDIVVAVVVVVKMMINMMMVVVMVVVVIIMMMYHR